jgi:hypothetical protein
VQRAACSVQRAACSVQRAACSVQRAACSVHARTKKCEIIHMVLTVEFFAKEYFFWRKRDADSFPLSLISTAAYTAAIITVKNSTIVPMVDDVHSLTWEKAQ